ncbi:MAG: undecaprenyl-diphosphate phosphatase [Planctomycetaceae bacterium]|nr:undecaprenyl-diphosphate phosphatase [Planctomycetaceae bacterium]
MDWIQTLLMAIVQGIAEFLPISSSGHLCVLYDLFEQLGVEIEASSLTLNIALHFGTLLSIFVVFWKRIWLLLSSDRRVILLLILATIPAVIGKVVISKTVGDDSVFENSLLAGICFPITGLLLLWCSNRSGETICRNLSWIHAAIIGLIQAVALLPGISRSGSTICGGLLCGMKRDEAATFSFLMAIPAIGGGALLEIVSLLKKQASDSPEVISGHGMILLFLGVLVSCLVGILTLKLLIRWLHQGKLKYFAYWLFLIGPVVIVWRLFFA